MAKLTDKIENVLNETRILVLGIQILIGFAFRSFFEPGFEQMAPYARLLQLLALGLMLLVLGVLLIPVPYHRMVLHGRNTAQLHRLATLTTSTGLLPFAMAMAVSFFLGAQWVVGVTASAIFAGVVLGVTLFFWYGLEIHMRRKKLGAFHLYAVVDPLRGTDMTQEDDTPLSTRVKQALIECRVVLPGAQALLGFQLIIMWMTAFYKIPQWWKLLHLASLSLVAICTILLITPAAYHRIVERGEDSEELHQITAQALLWSMGFLALGVSSDFFLVARVTGLSETLSGVLAAGLLAIFGWAWFGYSAWKRKTIQPRRLAAPHLKRQGAS